MTCGAFCFSGVFRLVCIAAAAHFTGFVGWVCFVTGQLDVLTAPLIGPEDQLLRKLGERAGIAEQRDLFGIAERSRGLQTSV